MNKKISLKHNNNRGEHMTKEDLWNLFKMTGKIEYYLEYKKRSD